MKVIKSGTELRLYSDNLETFDKIPAGFYSISFGTMTGWSLEVAPALEVKEKVYGVNSDKVSKVLKAFKRSNKNLGVILSGDKGIGKSLTARMISIKAAALGYPVIIVSTYIPGIASFLNSIEQECVVLMDEFDKTFGSRDEDSDTISDPQTEMLSLFDGISSGKKLFIVTCNDLYGVSSFLVNRPGRFHYHFRFDYPTADGIYEYLHDKGITDKKIRKVIEFSHKVQLNYDCLHAIAFELEDGGEFEDAINDLNIINMNEQIYNITVYFTDGTMLRAKEKLNLFSSEETSTYFFDKEHRAIGRITYVPSDVSDFNGKEVLTPSHCTWDIDDDLKSALNTKNNDFLTPAARESAEFWSKQRLDHVEFMFSESRNYKYTV